MNGYADSGDWDEQEIRAIREHQTIAQLLHGRGYDQAALIVAASGYGCHDVGFNGGACEVALAVPVPLYDAVTEDLRLQIETAARDVIGPEYFSRLVVTVRLAGFDPDWAVELITVLRAQRSPTPMRAIG
jgi:hypothetical protein